MPSERLARLTETAHFVDELLNRSPNAAQPYVGKYAFAHKAGMHAAGVQADAQTFEHVDPVVVGNRRDVLISELSGKATIAAKASMGSTGAPDGGASTAGSATDDDFTQRVVERVKELEHEGFQFEAADGSFELLMRKEAGTYEPLFRLESWRVLVEKRADGKVATEATIKIFLGGERYVRTAEGNGPVNALDNALREAIGEIHPHLRDIQLVNFKVRILDETKGTGAVTRVLIDASDGREVWGSIGVSENLIAASWDALVDSLEYGMQPGKAAPGTGEGDAVGGADRCVSAEPIPLARPVLGEVEERAVVEVLRSGQLSLGPRLASIRASVRRARRGSSGERALKRHRGASPGASRRRRDGRRRGGHLAVLVRGIGQRRALRAGAAGVRRHRSAHAQPRPRCGRGGDHRAHAGAPSGSHLRLPGRAARVRAARREARARDRRGRVRGARCQARGRGRRRVDAAILPCSASTPTSS